MFLNNEQHVLFMRTWLPVASEKLRVLDFLLCRQEKISIRETAKTLKLSPSHVSAIAASLEKGGLAKGKRVDFTNPSVRAFKILLNVRKLEGLSGRLKKLDGFLGCGLYGSWANGTNALESDCDLWLKTSKAISMLDRGVLESDFSEKLGVRCSVLAVTPSVLEELKRRDFVFYCALSNSFVLAGEGI